MSSLTLVNIGCLVNIRAETHLIRGRDMNSLPSIQNAFLIVEDDLIVSFGSMDEYTGAISGNNIVDAENRYILPCWCDSHTHLVFPASREGEFIDKINGLTYAEIAAKGGGILNSAARLQDMSADQLFNDAWKRLEEIALTGTGAVEIKSGYGLTVEGELKMLRVIKRLKEKSPLTIRSSFLGAHAFPSAYSTNHQGYIDQIINEMLPVIAGEDLADYIDVFCEKGFFSLDETEQVCRAGIKLGLKTKLHANQLNDIGAVELGVRLGAVSVDHLETMHEPAIEVLSASDTIGTLLPSAAFFLNMPYPPARKLISKGAALALATDFNPGSSPGGNMNFVLSLACIAMKMLPAEAITAATINGAAAMGIAHSHGSITIGKKANLILTRKIPSIDYLPYRFSANLIERVMIAGNWIT